MLGLKMSKEFEPVEVRHYHVGDHYMGSEALNAIESLAAIAGRRGEVSPARHNLAETLPRRFFIVHDEHTLVGHIESLAQRSSMKRIGAGEVRGSLAQTTQDVSLLPVRANYRRWPIAR